MPSELRQLPSSVQARDPRAVEEAFRVIASLVEPTPSVAYTVGAEDANARRFTIQVTDNLPPNHRQQWTGRRPVLVYITATEDGNPSATGNTFALVKGTVLLTLTANAAYLILSDTDGIVEFDLTVSGAANRVVHALPLRVPVSSGVVAWA